MLSAFAARKKAASPSPSPISIDNDLEIDSHPQTETTNLAEGAEVPKSTKFRASPPIHASSKRKQIQNDTSNPPSKRKKRNTSTTGSVALAGSRKNLMPTLIQEQNNEYQDRTLVPISRGYSPSEPVMVEGETSDTINQPTLISNFQPQLDQNVFFDFQKRQDHSSLDPTPITTSTPVIYLIFRQSDTLSFLGTVLLTVLQGSILLLGSPLHASSIPHSVFAPKSQPVATISVISEASDYYASSPPSKSQRLPERFIVSDLPQKIKDTVSSSDVVIKIQDLNSGVQGLRDICGEHHVFFKALPDFDFDFKLCEFYPIRYNSPPLSPLIVSPQWEDALSLLATTEDIPSVLIKGPKNSGKSVFLRMLVNRLLLKYGHKFVAYIDCDPGQTEFTPPGMVSLHILCQPILGPPFTHPRQAFKAHFVGSTSIRSSISHFLACIDDLLESYRLDVRHTYQLEHEDHNGDYNDESDEIHLEVPKEVPLVINTFGWVKGVGADALHHIERKADLTHVISLEPSSLDPVWIAPTTTHESSTGTTYFSIPAFEHTRQDQNQANRRALMIMSYFYHEEIVDEVRKEQRRQKERRGFTKWVTYKPLCARPPWEVTWDATIDKIILIGSGAEDVVQSELLRVLNGAVVALVSAELQGHGRVPSSSTNRQSQDQGKIPYEQAAAPPTPNVSNCLGIALVRSVRPANGALHIITPVAPSLLARCRMIVMGEIRLPVWGMLDHRPESKNADQIAGVDLNLVPFLDWGKGPQGISGAKALRVRRNIMRKAQA